MLKPIPINMRQLYPPKASSGNSKNLKLLNFQLESLNLDLGGKLSYMTLDIQIMSNLITGPSLIFSNGLWFNLYLPVFHFPYD